MEKNIADFNNTMRKIEYLNDKLKDESAAYCKYQSDTAKFDAKKLSTSAFLTSQYEQTKQRCESLKKLMNYAENRIKR